MFAAAALAACVAVSANAIGAGAPCGAAEVLKGARGTWTVMPGPKFPLGEQQITAHSIDRVAPDVHYVTNGSIVMRSADGGCAWEESFRLPDAPTPAMPVVEAVGRIARLEASDGVVLAAVAAPRKAVPEALPGADVITVLARSPDGGQTWGGGPPAILPGEPGPIAFAYGEGAVFVATGGFVHRSSDGGATFTTTAPPGEPARIESLVASVTQVAGGVIVWAKAADGPAFRSTDGGVTWRRYGAEEGPGAPTAAGPTLQPVAVGNHESRVTFFDTDPQSRALRDILYSANGGEIFERVGKASVEGVEGRLESFDGEQRRGDVVVSTADSEQAGSGGIYRFHPRLKRLVSIDEFALGPLRGAQAAHVHEDRVRYRFFDDDEVVMYEEAVGGAVALPVPGSVEDFNNADPGPARLLPSGGEVRVPAGGSRTLAYRLELPARSARLDTFFVLDTSNSTDDYINGLRIGVTRIARGLARAGVEARFGLAEYQDMSLPQGLRYARRADIGPADLLRNALARLETAGGEEPGYTAVHQALTGSGVSGPRTGLPVARGQQAHWRDRSLRTIVLVADESFAFDPDGATRDAVVSELRKSGVSFVGVLVSDPDAAPPEPGEVPPCSQVVAERKPSEGGSVGAARLHCQLEDLAAAAGTVAPAGGIDCDGDGKVDVPAGRAAVCNLPRTSSTAIVAVADPLRRLLLAVTDEQPVAVRAAGEAGERVAVAPRGDYSKLDLKRAHALGFQVRFTCAREDARRRFAVTLDAAVAGRDVARAAPTLVCEPRPAAAVPAPRRPRKRPREAPARPESPPAPAPAPAIFSPAPPAPAPAPVPVPLVPPATVPPPAPAPATAPAPAQAPATAVAVAARPQTAAATTLLHVDEDHVESTEMNFSDGGAIRTVGIAGVLVVAALAWPVRPRRSPRPLFVRVSDTEPPRRRRRRRS